MSKKKDKKIIKIVAAVVVFVLIVTALAILVFDPFAWRSSSNGNDETPATIEVEDDEKITLAKQLYAENSAISDDYVGTIKFESGLIDLPFVQGSDNNTYYRTNWKTMEYDEEGSIFLDSNNTLDDQNLILIGHYVYASYDDSGTHMFTPLAKLIDESNYEDNKYVELYLDGEIRRYEIAYVYYCQLISDETDGESFYYTEDGYEFYVPNYTQEMFENYIKTVKENAFYDTGVEVSYSDKFLTLQTCVENRDDLREIVLLKEIERTTYEK